MRDSVLLVVCLALTTGCTEEKAKPVVLKVGVPLADAETHLTSHGAVEQQLAMQPPRMMGHSSA